MKTIADIIHHKTIPMSILDSNDNNVYYETFNGLWIKLLFKANGKRIYFENSSGYIQDNRQ